MKKAFDQNVSRAKPRLRLGMAITEAESTAPGEAPAPTAQLDLEAAVKARMEQARAPKAPVAELPVLQVVSALHFIADMTLALGTVEHDYLA